MRERKRGREGERWTAGQIEKEEMERGSEGAGENGKEEESKIWRGGRREEEMK